MAPTKFDSHIFDVKLSNSHTLMKFNATHWGIVEMWFQMAKHDSFLEIWEGGGGGSEGGPH